MRLSGYEDRADAANDFRCFFRATDIGFFRHGDFMDVDDVEDDPPTDFVDCNNNNFFNDIKEEKCRYDNRSWLDKHMEKVETVNGGLERSLHGIYRERKKSLPFRWWRGSRKTVWNYSISYRKPGVYLRIYNSSESAGRRFRIKHN